MRFRGGMRVTGQLVALIVQPSVVSLEPVTEEIEEPIDRVFLPGGEKAFAGQADAEVFVDLDGEDIPDHFEGNEADLSDLIVETLGARHRPLSAHRRAKASGASGTHATEDEPPFAGLKALKLPEDKG